MKDAITDVFYDSLRTGFIDKTIKSEVLYQPELLTNKTKPTEKVLTTIIKELNNCNSFFISVAFVTTSGVATLINTLKTLEERGIKGKILVSQYLNFTQPEALRRLLNFKNIELKIATKENSHSKGYIFKTRSYYNLIIGSSNLTASALATNKEWNLKVSALIESSIATKVINEFELDFAKGVQVTSEFIDAYDIIYQKQFILSKEHTPNNANAIIEPNSMQREALENIATLRSQGKNKALLISATGTGKTYLSAFDAKAFQPKRLLFVVHRRNIAEKAMESFQSVFGNMKSMGLYSGAKRELDKDFVFSTVQTISKQNHLEQIPTDHFDYIIIDESHRSGAASYQRLVNYFSPKFLLGMTATPERTDGNDIFSMFDHNIAYEIRLNRAMEEDMLSQFHYYGVTDLLVDDEKLEDTTDFNRLTADDRVEQIITNAKFYGCDNGIIRGLVFCAKNDESRELSDKFNKQGYKTIALSGKSSEEERIDAIRRLESDSISQKLDYIFTVDIFNEGIDIQKINQILMIRPTDSAIVFIQQLGRGLRKTEGKGYLTVIDFIGNYKNNYLIPIALYGDTSYNKDTIRKLISEGSKMIPGASTINFDEITKERIFKSIDSANMKLLADLKKDYYGLKYKLGRSPLMMDFIEHGERDPFLFVEHSRSYYNFVNKVDKDFKSELTIDAAKLLEIFSKEINNSKRVEECLILKALLTAETLSVESLKAHVYTTYGYSTTNETITSCLTNLNFEFIRDKKNGKMLPLREIFDLDIVVLQDGIFQIQEMFKKHLEDKQFRIYLLDSVEYAINIFNSKFTIDTWRNGFVLYRKYSRKDVFRILNIAENPVAQNVGGYMVTPNKEHCPIFVNYHKEDHISESTKYEDEFINNKEFNYMSKSKRKLDSNDVKAILGEYGDIRLPLFIKKSNDEGTEFYFMGDVYPEKDKAEQQTMGSDSGKQVSVVKFLFNLKDPVSDSIYEYLRQSVVSNSIIKPVKQDTVKLKEESKQLTIELEYHAPLYDFYAAAGRFSEMQSAKDYTAIVVPEKYSNGDYFACRIMGESMNKIIPNGSTCLFKQYAGGSRNGKIVLVENIDYQDPDSNSAFTIKTYSSEKVVTEEGWKHESITLRPNSYDETYKNIIIDESNGAEMKIIGEFVMVL